jgi:translocation and assembly module TamB
VSGQAAYAAGVVRSFDVQASGRGVTLRYPEGLRSQLDADLRFFGDARSRWVTGGLDVRQALYNKRYELASELLAVSGAALPGRSAGLGRGGLRYDVKLRVPGTLRIDNNLTTLQARADLTLQGSYEAPVVVGRAEVDRGRVYFQGNTYVIRRGTIDFVDPQKIDPRFDIEAEARVRSYRVTLKVAGTLERVYPTLTSDPPLSAVQILNLLAGADESTVASLTLSQTDQAKLAAAGAATLAAGRLSEQVGLERGAERLFGINRFSIDPSVVKGGVTNPTARLTVGKRLTPDLNVQYSTDLRGTEDRVLSVEYTLSDRLSLLLTRTEPGGYGFDLQLRHAYR